MSTSDQDQGLSLLDLGPLHENVTVVTGKAVRVFGLSAKGLFLIFQRFPQVGKWFKGGVTVKIEPQALLAEVPGAISAIIAAGCGEAGNPKAEEVAERFPVEAQLDILEAVLKLTFRSGFGPFVQRMVALSEVVKSQNYGRGSVTTSPQGSKPALPQDTTVEKSGT